MPKGVYPRTKKKKVHPPLTCSLCGGEIEWTKARHDRLAKRGRIYCPGECRRLGTNSHKPSWEQRFWAQTKRLPNGCLEWTGAVSKDGYAVLRMGKKKHPVLRVAWFLHYGEWPPAHMKCDHNCHRPGECDLGNLCRHRRCAEWSHANLVTHKENCSPERSNASRVMRENNPVRNRARFAAQTHCKRGHERTPENVYITKQGWKSCRVCSLIDKRARRKREKEEHGREQQTGNNA